MRSVYLSSGSRWLGHGKDKHYEGWQHKRVVNTFLHGISPIIRQHCNHGSSLIPNPQLLPESAERFADRRPVWLSCHGDAIGDWVALLERVETPPQHSH